MSKGLQVDIEKLAKAMSGLRGAFDWKESEEGFEYWQAIENRLIRIFEGWSNAGNR